MSMYYIKVNHDILSDPTIASMPDHLWRRYIECQLAAGIVDEEGFLPETTELAWVLRTTVPELESTLQQLMTKGLLEMREYPFEPQRYFATRFEQEQQRRKSNAQAARRMRRYRAKKKEKNQKKEKDLLETGKGDQEYIDIDIEPLRNSYVTRYVTRYAPDMPEFDLKRHPGLNTDEFYDAFVSWLRYQDERGTPVGQSQGDALLEEFAAMGASRAVASIKHSMARGWRSPYEPKKEDGKEVKSAPVSAAQRSAQNYAALKAQFNQGAAT